MSVEELYERCTELARTEPSAAANRFMHETLVLCCAEALKTSEMAFGNLFSQVDFLTKRCGMKTADRMAVQQMRRHSNRSEVLSREEWLQQVRSLTRFVSALFKTSVPDELTRLIPHHQEAPELSQHAFTSKAPYIRCIVSRFDEQTLWGDTSDGKTIVADYTGHDYLRKMLREGMQLNLLDCRVEDEGGERKVGPGIVVVEPDFLLDISAVARCFQGNYGHHPLLYTAERLKPRSNSQAILLGNFAGAALDDIIRSEAGGQQDEGDKPYRFDDSLNRFISKQALQVASCEDFNDQRFADDAQQQAANIEEAVSQLFDKDYDCEKALLEPSFVCEQLGLQGRVDLMTSDMRLLVEQKSGKNYSLERNSSHSSPSAIHYKEEHYVQLLLYYGILRYNFGRTDSQVDIRLLYSRYPAARGLLYVNFYRELFREAIRLRNQIVATEQLIAREGFGRIRPLLQPDVVFRDAERDGYFHRYIEPPLSTLRTQLSALNPTEQAYYDRMMTFVYREQLLSKVGRQEGQGSAVSDLWNMPLAEKQETGNIILSDQPSATLNFRRGDMVYVYHYDEHPDVRKAILYKGIIEEIGSSGVKVKLNNGQQQANPMQLGKWAIEHADSDINTNSAMKSLHQLMTAHPRKRKLLLGGLTPEADTTLRLSRSYHPHYDDILLQAKQARDYYLLVGPPGTGKTSMALRFMVEEAEGDLLLMSYTNRAVDEICAMLDDAGQQYLRISNSDTCPPSIDGLRIVVGTTSMLQARPFIFQKKHFSLCIVDEASQITEPGLVGLLSSDHIDRFILVGDHKQLPAVVQQTEQESKVTNPLLTAIGITDCRQSLFERLLLWERHCGRTQFTGTLRKQGRMHPDIAQFPNQMFYRNERLEPVPLAHQLDTSLHYDLPSTDETDELLKRRRVIFWDSGEDGANGAHGGEPLSDKVNAVEAVYPAQ